MDQITQTRSIMYETIPFRQAWEMIIRDLRENMSRVDYDRYIRDLQPLGLNNNVFSIGVPDKDALPWLESRARGRIKRHLEGFFPPPISLEFQPSVNSTIVPHEEKNRNGVDLPLIDEGRTNLSDNELPSSSKNSSKRKLLLEAAYGSERARIIQPDRTLYVTFYLFSHWLPIIGHSAFSTILAARSMCYWNPITGEKRNTVETDMTELAEKASVSVRTVKSVLADEIIQKYFLRYNVRRMMTINGVRTAGIILHVRMDDPLTPEDQENNNISEPERWYSLDFEKPILET